MLDGVNPTMAGKVVLLGLTLSTNDGVCARAGEKDGVRGELFENSMTVIRRTAMLNLAARQLPNIFYYPRSIMCRVFLRVLKGYPEPSLPMELSG
jgi:hypothetical protein